MKFLDEINHFYYRMSLYELQTMNGTDLYNGLSYNSLLYINVIDQMEDCTASKIADALNITKPAVTLKINELVKQGVILKKQSDADKRVYYLTLSPQMEHIINIYDEIFEIVETRLKKKYTEEEIELFTEILHTISGYEWRKIKNE